MKGKGLGIMSVLIVLMMLSPLVVLVISAFDDGKFFRFPPQTWSLRWFRVALDSAEYRRSLLNSSIVASSATILSVSLGTMASAALHRGPIRRGVLELVLLAPLTLPLVIWAIGLMQVYSWMGISGSLGGLILAHATFTLPLSVRIMLGSFSAVDPALEQAALTLGARPWQAFWRITLPLLVPGLAAAAGLSFFISFNDVIVSTLIAGAGWITYPVRMYSQLRGQGIDPATLAIGAMVIAAILVLTIIVETLSKKAARR